MVDRVTASSRARASRPQVRGLQRALVPGSLSARPIMPGVLILEALAQIGGILAYVSEPFDPRRTSCISSVSTKPSSAITVMPGDRLDLYVEVLHHRSNVWKLRGEASVDGTLCARASCSPRSSIGALGSQPIFGVGLPGFMGAATSRHMPGLHSAMQDR